MIESIFLTSHAYTQVRSLLFAQIMDIYLSLYFVSHDDSNGVPLRQLQPHEHENEEGWYARERLGPETRAAEVDEQACLPLSGN